MGGATGMCGGDNVPLNLRHVPLRGYNKIQIRLHLLTSLRVTKLCFNLFPAEIDGIRSCYYHTMQKRSKIHLQPSQVSKFSGEETPGPNGVDLTGLLGGHKGRLGIWGTEVPERGPGQSPGRGSGDKVPQKLKLFL